MEFRFANRKLAELYEHGVGASKLPEEVVRAFAKCMRLIESASSEQDFRALKSLHFEKLKGTPGRRSVRLNRAWRLEFALEKSGGQTVVAIQAITKHYND